MQNLDNTYPTEGGILAIVNEAGLVLPENRIELENLTLLDASGDQGILVYDGTNITMNGVPVGTARGQTGPAGPTGNTGPSGGGIQGPPGPIGITSGVVGTAGPVGRLGAVGSQGAAATSGYQGPAGPSGQTGAAGAMGVIGGTIPLGNGTPPATLANGTNLVGGMFQFTGLGLPSGYCNLRGSIAPNGPIAAGANAYVQVDLFEFATLSTFQTLSVTYIPPSIGPAYGVDRFVIPIDLLFDRDLYQIRVYMINCSIAMAPFPTITYSFTYIPIPG